MNKKTNIVLIGFMGTGKTSVGLRISEITGMRFVDTDDIIEDESKMSISEIFSKMGEDYFRDLESESVKKVSQLSNHVISTGGGVVKRGQNVNNLKSTGIIFCLDTTPELIMQRTKNYSHRPLLQVEDPVSHICKMLREREPFYACADHRIDTSNLTINQVAEKIIGIFFKYYELSSPVE